MIRRLTAVLLPPTLDQVQVRNGVRTLTWPAISNQTYHVQFKTALEDPVWIDLGGEVTAPGPSASKTDTPGQAPRFYRLVTP